MLNFKEKVEIFTSLLNQEETSYGDSFNGEILLYSENCDLFFLKKINSKKDIKKWIDKLKSRIIMRDDDDLTEEIINDYILCG
jgi:hypothetical protein